MAHLLATITFITKRINQMCVLAFAPNFALTLDKRAPGVMYSDGCGCGNCCGNCDCQ